MAEIILRGYQQECVDTLNSLEHGSYLVVMATGLGKTVVFSAISSCGRILILSHREELVRQPEKYYDCPFGIEQAKYHSHGEKVVSASVQSIVNRLEDFSPNAFDIIITDEAHHAPAETYRRIYSYFTPRLHIGFTATPNRADKVKLGEIYSEIVFERDLKWGIRNGYLSDIRCLQVDIGFDISKVKKTADDLNVNQLADVIDDPVFNAKIAQTYREQAVGQTLIFAASVSHAKNIASLIKDAAVITAETKNRAEIIEKFTAREIPCLVNCMVCTEGLDLPLIETVMIARPTSNALLYSQMVGRGLRLYPGKKELLLIDFVGITGKLRICSPPDLFGIEDIPEYVHRNDFNGKLLTKIDRIVAGADDMLFNYKLYIKQIDLFKQDGKYDIRDINFAMMHDGALACELDENMVIYIEPADLSGNTEARLMRGRSTELWITDRAPMQDILDKVYSLLVCKFQKQKSLWDIEKVKKWGSAPVSEFHIKKINGLMKKLKIKSEINEDEMTKYTASILISKLKYMKLRK